MLGIAIGAEKSSHSLFYVPMNKQREVRPGGARELLVSRALPPGTSLSNRIAHATVSGCFHLCFAPQQALDSENSKTQVSKALDGWQRPDVERGIVVIHGCKA